MSIANTQTETIIQAGIIDAGDQVLARVEHLKELEKLVGNSYPNKFERTKISGREDTISNILHFAPIIEVVAEIKAHVATLAEREKPDQELKDGLNLKLKEFGDVKVSGRLTTTPRTMGKAAFVHLSDGVNRLQIYVRRDDVKGLANDGKHSEIDGWELFKLLDGGDFVGVAGFLFLTNTGELSIHVETIQFLSKALLPMPDKMHGIADPELQRRFRYADLIASSLQIEHEGLTTREVFERRAKLISGMRRFLDDAGYIEVETPMLTPKATGAAAEPFETHHKALGIPLYARIAPELYLKRLTVGGFEKVYELNRNFRNEGLSHKHNPEFTMLEFYCAYMDVNGMMDFAEAMIKESVQKAVGSLQIGISTNLKDVNDGHDIFQITNINFDKFERLTMTKAIIQYLDFKFIEDEKGNEIEITDDWLLQSQNVYVLWVASLNWREKAYDIFETMFGNEFSFSSFENWRDVLASEPDKWKMAWKANFLVTQTSFLAKRATELLNKDRLIEQLFEFWAEENLHHPTFIIDYPKSISPLSKASPDNPQIAERFELFINGMEVANGFSELNDPQEQYERFVDQMKERETGDHEAMVLDEDYIRALAYGMPPAAGIGIGIDRLVMLLTDKHSIRDVILFPHMRPEKREEEK
jgi:lysyl-tRNA synthetase, class II